MDKKNYMEDVTVSSFDKLKPHLNVITTGAVVLGLIAAFQERIAETERTSKVDESALIDSAPAQAPSVEQHNQGLYNRSKSMYGAIISRSWALYPYYQRYESGACFQLDEIPLLIEGKNWKLDARDTGRNELPMSAFGCPQNNQKNTRDKKTLVLKRQTGQTENRLTFEDTPTGIYMYRQVFEIIHQNPLYAQNPQNLMTFYKEKGPKTLIASIHNSEYCSGIDPMRMFGESMQCEPDQNPQTLNQWLMIIDSALIAQPGRAQAAQKAAKDKAAADALKELEKATK